MNFGKVKINAYGYLIGGNIQETDIKPQKTGTKSVMQENLQTILKKLCGIKISAVKKEKSVISAVTIPHNITLFLSFTVKLSIFATYIVKAEFVK